MRRQPQSSGSPEYGVGLLNPTLPNYNCYLLGSSHVGDCETDAAPTPFHLVYISPSSIDPVLVRPGPTTVEI
jgi:hypothetical protein